MLRTLPTLWGSGWYKASALKRDLGIGPQLSFPAIHKSQNLEAFVASPPNLQLIPTRATGQETGVPFVEEVPLRVPLISEVQLLGLLRCPLVLGLPFIASLRVDLVPSTVPGETCAPFEIVSGAILDRKLVTNRDRGGNGGSSKSWGDSDRLGLLIERYTFSSTCNHPGRSKPLRTVLKCIQWSFPIIQ